MIRRSQTLSHVFYYSLFNTYFCLSNSFKICVSLEFCNLPWSFSEKTFLYLAWQALNYPIFCMTKAKMTLGMYIIQMSMTTLRCYITFFWSCIYLQKRITTVISIFMIHHKFSKEVVTSATKVLFFLIYWYHSKFWSWYRIIQQSNSYNICIL